MPTVAVDGVDLYHEVVGEGPPILVLHGGLGMDHSYFRPDFDRLADLGRVVYVDHRGNGRSARTDEPLTIEVLAADAAVVVDAIGGPVTVIGHSFGGFIAQELAISHPEAVARLVLLDTTPGQLGEADDPAADQGPPPPPELAELFATMPADDRELEAHMARLAPFYVYGPHEVLLDRMAHTVYRLRAMQEGFASLAAWSSVDRLGGLTMPTLLIAGEHDLFTSRQQAERIARLVPDAALHVFERSGHFPWLEEPDVFWDVLLGWLGS